MLFLRELKSSYVGDMGDWMNMRMAFACAVLAAAWVSHVPAALAQQPAASTYEEKRRDVNKNTVTIMGSGAKTAYTEFAEDMQNVLDDPKTGDLRVLPILGRGGGQNLVDVMFLSGIDIGIMERDVFEEFKGKDPALYGNLENRLVYLLKLSNSEMHFFARPEIKKLEDLRGKKVSFFKPLSSSALAVQTILGACEIEVEPVYLDTELGAEKLRSGEIAAVGRISAAPHGALVNFTREDGHFLPLDEENLPPGCYAKLMKTYLPAILKHDHYPKVLTEDEAVPTVAGATLLATYNFLPGTERYLTIERFVTKLFNNIDKFRDGPRHPKWKEVNIAAEVPGWKRFKGAQDWIDANVASRNTRNPDPGDDLRSAFDRFLEQRIAQGQRLSVAQKQTLLDEFTKWWNDTNARQGRR